MKLANLFILSLGFLLVLGEEGFAHGTVDDPESRVLMIYREGPESPSSPAAQAAIAWAGGNQYYTWNEVSQNVPNYNDPIFAESYAAVIPDGRLASGNNTAASNLDFTGMDLVSPDWDWPATPISSGPYVINWLATAPHDPSFFKVWITKEGYDPKTVLSWGQMEFLGKFEPSDYTKEGQNYRIPVTLPERSGRHVIYVAWQRIDPVGEVFFSTSDVIFDGEGGGGAGDSLVLSVEDVTVNEADGFAELKVALNRELAEGEEVAVDYATADGTAIAGDDYLSVSGSLVFTEGEMEKLVQIPIVDDEVEESVEFFSFNLSGLQGAVAANLSAMVTIIDDDYESNSDLGYDFEVRDDWGSGYNGWLRIENNGSAAINNGEFVITVPDGQGVTAFGGVSLANNGDGTFSLFGVSIAAGGAVMIDLGFSNASGGGRGPSQMSYNGDVVTRALPVVSIDDVSVLEGDGPGSVELTVTLSRAYEQPIHVSYQTFDGTAIAPDDYTETSGNFVFAPGELSKTIAVAILGNLIDEPDKTFTVALAGVVGEEPPRFAGEQGNIAKVTLLNDDGPVSFTATGGAVIEGDSGTHPLRFRLFLDREVKPGEVVSVDFMTHSHTATAGEDFVPRMGTYLFEPGTRSGTIDVQVIGDMVDERHEYFMLHFSNPVGMVMVSSHAVGQIIDDDFDRSNLGRQRVVAYLDGTSGSLNLPPAERVTHIMYAFANLNADGSLALGPSVPAHLATLNSLKQENPELKVILSVGGWTWSGNFPSVANDPAKRAAFASSCVEVVTTHALDGIDVDWEWPGVPGGPGTNPTAEDGVNYTLLLQELRAALDAAGSDQVPAKHYEITAFTAASPAGIAVLELEKLAEVFDFINPQGYDLHGPWNGQTGHNAGLFHNSADPLDSRLNIDSVLQQYLAGGFKRSQLLIGAPFYARVFNEVGATANGAFQPSSGVGSTLLYRDLTSLLESLPRQWDHNAKVPFLYDPETRVWISYDDPQAMHEKAMYSRNGGFGGIYYWRNGGDTDDQELLITLSDSLAMVDSDGDGIDDGWEIANFGDLTTANATSDFSGNGVNDLTEYLFGTNPRDGKDFPILRAAGDPTENGFFEFATRAGVAYHLESSETLEAGSWQQVGEEFEGDGQVINLGLPPAHDADTKRFYRIRALPQ